MGFLKVDMVIRDSNCALSFWGFNILIQCAYWHDNLLKIATFVEQIFDCQTFCLHGEIFARVGIGLALAILAILLRAHKDPAVRVTLLNDEADGGLVQCVSITSAKAARHSILSPLF